MSPPSPDGAFSLYQVHRVCPECGECWDGPSFVPQPPDHPPLPRLCASCGAVQEERIRAAQLRPAMAVEIGRDLDLDPPQRVGR